MENRYLIVFYCKMRISGDISMPCSDLLKETLDYLSTDLEDDALFFSPEVVKWRRL